MKRIAFLEAGRIADLHIDAALIPGRSARWADR
jgi:hypothetical protein